MGGPNPHEVVSFVVLDRTSGNAVYHELLASARYSVDRLNDRMVHRVAQLEHRYPFPQYEVESGIYTDRETFYDHNPACRPEQEGVT